MFSAISGSSVATAATMGSVALPYFEKKAYNQRMVLGSLAAGGALGNLIPPGITFIVYGLMTETSVGKLYIAADRSERARLPAVLSPSSSSTACGTAEQGNAAAGHRAGKTGEPRRPDADDAADPDRARHDLRRHRDADRSRGARRGRLASCSPSSPASSPSSC